MAGAFRARSLRSDRKGSSVREEGRDPSGRGGGTADREATGLFKYEMGMLAEKGLMFKSLRRAADKAVAVLAGVEEVHRAFHYAFELALYASMRAAVVQPPPPQQQQSTPSHQPHSQQPQQQYVVMYLPQGPGGGGPRAILVPSNALQAAPSSPAPSTGGASAPGTARSWSPAATASSAATAWSPLAAATLQPPPFPTAARSPYSYPQQQPRRAVNFEPPPVMTARPTAYDSSPYGGSAYGGSSPHMYGTNGIGYPAYRSTATHLHNYHHPPTASNPPHNHHPPYTAPLPPAAPTYPHYPPPLPATFARPYTPPASYRYFSPPPGSPSRPSSSPHFPPALYGSGGAGSAVPYGFAASGHAPAASSPTSPALLTDLSAYSPRGALSDGGGWPTGAVHAGAVHAVVPGAAPGSMMMLTYVAAHTTASGEVVLRPQRDPAQPPMLVVAQEDPELHGGGFGGGKGGGGGSGKLVRFASAGGGGDEGAHQTYTYVPGLSESSVAAAEGDVLPFLTPYMGEAAAPPWEGGGVRRPVSGGGAEQLMERFRSVGDDGGGGGAAPYAAGPTSPLPSRAAELEFAAAGPAAAAAAAGGSPFRHEAPRGGSGAPAAPPLPPQASYDRLAALAGLEPALLGGGGAAALKTLAGRSGSGGGGGGAGASPQQLRLPDEGRLRKAEALVASAEGGDWGSVVALAAAVRRGPEWVIDSTYELFMDLGASDELCEFPVVYASGVNGTSGMTPDTMHEDLQPLFDTIVREVNPPAVAPNEPLQMLCANIDYDEHKGRIAIGRVSSGTIKRGQSVAICSRAQEAGEHGAMEAMRRVQRLLQRHVQLQGRLEAVAVGGGRREGL
ncbi:GTP-binding protein TypA/BipA [Tetrabaena socialis]|uniref:GTP-binding protein TypA/BipA n=1 Tax=Tetrabaena socialis TaxID=47790 RepID=A0A2J8A096_9CHLO|nr:GTP-binding protein TypA/BipA [Tetrabaena socialis]|eukprot:PNH05935.1 GTP-binding protein TypA/BipA [Tetrabaena socialis]